MREQTFTARRKKNDRKNDPPRLRKLCGMSYRKGMAALTVEYPDDLLLASGRQRQEVEAELRLQLGARLFELGHLSLGKAAELAGLLKPQFSDALGRMKIPVINLDEEEIQAELHALRDHHHRR